MEELSLDYKNNYTIYKAKNLSDKWLVLVNGLFAGREAWALTAKFMSGEYNVLTYDGPGQGENKLLVSVPTIKSQIDYLLETLEEIGIEKFDLVGISNGARIAMAFASIFPAKVERLVIADTYYKIDRTLRLKLESWLKANEDNGAEGRFSVSIPWIFGQTFINKNQTSLNQFKKAALTMSQERGRLLIQSAFEEIEDYKLEKIVAPTLILVGDEDCLTPISYHKDILKNIFHSSLKIVSGGHASLYEEPNHFENIIVPFLKCEREKLNFLLLTTGDWNNAMA